MKGFEVEGVCVCVCVCVQGGGGGWVDTGLIYQELISARIKMTVIYKKRVLFVLHLMI